MKNKLFFVFLVFLFLFNTAKAGITECTNITTSFQSYSIDNDITGGGSGDGCIIINASHVNVNCNGYLINSTGADNAIFIQGIPGSELTDINLFNCRLNNNPSDGLYIESVDNSNFTNISVDYNHVGVNVRYSDGNTFKNISVNSNDIEGFLIVSSDNNLFSELDIINNDFIGMFFSVSDNNNVTDTNLSDPADREMDFENSAGNRMSNIDIGGTVCDFTYSGDLEITSENAPSADPSGYKNIGYYLGITNQSSSAWVNLSVFYSDSDVSELNESSLVIYKYNGSWHHASSFSGSYGLDTSNNIVWANVTDFSTFAPMANSTLPVPEFSDLGWILAVILGSGGFLLIRKKSFSF